MITNDRIEIALSKVKLILALLGSIVFVLLGFCLIVNPGIF